VGKRCGLKAFPVSATFNCYQIVIKFGNNFFTAYNFKTYNFVAQRGLKQNRLLVTLCPDETSLRAF